MTKKKNVGLEEQLAALLEGIQQALPGAAPSLIVNGEVQTSAQVEQRLQRYLARFAAVREAESAFLHARSAREEQRQEALLFAQDLRTSLKAQLGRKAEVLAKFGISLAPRSRQSTETKAIGAAKRAAAKQRRRLGLAEPRPVMVVLGADGKPLGASGALAANADPATEAQPAVPSAVGSAK